MSIQLFTEAFEVAIDTLNRSDSSSWNVIKSEFIQKVDELHSTEDEEKKHVITSSILKMIAPHEEIRKIISATANILIVKKSLLSEAEKELHTFAHKSGLTVTNNDLIFAAQVIIPDSHEQNRIISMKPHGVGKATSTKLKNFKIGVNEISELIAGIMLSAHQAVDKPHPLIIGAAILLTIKALKTAITVEITPIEASVYWGILKSVDKNGLVQGQNIYKQTNKERKQIGLEPLSKKQVTYTLHQLTVLNAVEMVDTESSMWRIVEKPWII